MDRFFTIKFPLKYGRNKTRKFMLLKIVCVWLISSLISSPMFVLGLVDSTNVYHNDTKSSVTCFPNHSDFKLYGSVFAFCIPLAIITVTYSFTMRSLKILMRNKEEVKRRLSLERFNACQANGYFSANGCNTQELRKILIAANRAASAGFKRNELSSKRNFVKRHRSFAVANNTPNSVFR
jgi:heme/copper-type cytochrome/quinol oxidase subunit 1